MIKFSFSKISVFVALALVVSAHAADTGVNLHGPMDYAMATAWAAKSAQDFYLVPQGWNIGNAVRSMAVDVASYVRSYATAPVQPVIGAMDFAVAHLLPTDSEWTWRSEMMRIGSMALVIGVPMAIEMVMDKGEETVRFSAMEYGQMMKDRGLHCYKKHHHHDFLNPVAQLAAASVVAGAAPIVIASVASSDRPLTMALEAGAVAGTVCLLAQSYLCKKHHTELLLQDRKDALKKDGERLQEETAMLQEQLKKVDRELFELTRSKDSRYLEFC